MRYNKLGNSELIVSKVTLGNMTWGVQNSEADAHEQLSYAFKNGINILDTAEMRQGRTDRYVGKKPITQVYLFLLCLFTFAACWFLQVRYIGVSNETSFGVMGFTDAAEKLGLPKIVSIQNSYSLLVCCRFEGTNY
ncbi:hypothetical protein SELMODRAFT_423474 [Selaginella moellendorffii]|uniref:NADP-dependent oxidoreductase domain-containing protein n=1 Tax=Selaginella moellendorffii TaxID=88036 RepID=D8SLU2_SELML|nr:hypothetical protein SELMODRAFT_423474 [Selaginella moellendorffii]